MKTEIKFDTIEQITNVYMPVILDKNFSAQEKREFVKKAISQAVHKALEEAAEKVQMIIHDGHFKTNSPTKHVQIGANNVQVDKQSILSLKEKY